MVWFTAVGVLVVAAYYIYLIRKKREKPVMTEPGRSSERDFISLDRAREQVRQLISEKKLLIAESAIDTREASMQLGPMTKEFFSRYGGVKTMRGGFRISAADVRPSEYVQGFLSIGHSEDWDVVQRPGSDEVFVVEGSERADAELQAPFPTVYHLVIDEVQQLQGDPPSSK